jgi:FMN phosphatase YigB (HAD superfamily)
MEKVTFMSAVPPLRITAMAFDLGNVLVRVDHRRFCRRLAPLVGRSPQEVYAQVFESDLEPGYDTGRLSSREFYQRFVARFGLALSYAEFGALWTDIFEALGNMEEAVARLQKRYPLFLLSNTNPLHFDYIKQRFPSLLQHFQGFILSYRVGSRKPEAAIFQALIRRCASPPEHILYLDDKLPFVAAARAQGLRAWHFTTPRDFQRRLARYGLLVSGQ